MKIIQKNHFQTSSDSSCFSNSPSKFPKLKPPFHFSTKEPPHPSYQKQQRKKKIKKSRVISSFLVVNTGSRNRSPNPQPPYIKKKKKPVVLIQRTHAKHHTTLHINISTPRTFHTLHNITHTPPKIEKWNTPFTSLTQRVNQLWLWGWTLKPRCGKDVSLSCGLFLCAYGC
jgi:hypothetical protein